MKAPTGGISLIVQEYFSGSCAVAGFTNLGSMENAKHAMWWFCKNNLHIPTSGFASQSYTNGTHRILSAFYCFVAGPEVPKEAPGGSHHSKKWVKYGTEFAAFIETEGLGAVATTGPKLNIKHHPTSTCQVWIWSPDQKAMEKWWKKHKEE